MKNRISVESQEPSGKWRAGNGSGKTGGGRAERNTELLQQHDFTLITREYCVYGCRKYRSFTAGFLLNIRKWRLEAAGVKLSVIDSIMKLYKSLKPAPTGTG